MSTEYLSDREQEEALRSWWRENWRWVLSGIAVGFAALGAWNYWLRYTEQQGEAAAQAYRDLTAALTSNNKDKVEATVKNLDANYAGSPYVDQAHLLLAQAHVNGGRFEIAATELKTVVDKSKDAALAYVAKLRLARVHIQLGHYDEALALLDVNKAGVFAAQVHEIRGDALLAKGDTTGARAAYQAALLASQEASANRGPGGSEYLQLKLQSLSDTASGDAAPASPPAASTSPATPSATNK